MNCKKVVNTAACIAVLVFIQGCGFIDENALGKNTDDGTKVPFSGTPIPVPGLIELELFDKGGEGISYSDTSEQNLGGKLRPQDSVDIESCSDYCTGYNLVWIESGEWTEYTVKVAKTAVYRLTFRAAALGGNEKLRVLVGGVDLTGPVIIPETGSWDVWKNAERAGVLLTEGIHVLRLGYESSLMKLNWLKIEDDSGPIIPPV